MAEALSLASPPGRPAPGGERPQLPATFMRSISTEPIVRVPDV